MMIGQTGSVLVLKRLNWYKTSVGMVGAYMDCINIFPTINLYYTENCFCLELNKANRNVVRLTADR